MRRIRANRAAAVYPVVVAGLLHGVGRDAALSAAAAGDFPTIKVAGQILALAAPINKTLGLSGIDDPKVREAYRLAGIEPPPLKPTPRKPKTRNARKGKTSAVARNRAAHASTRADL